MCIRDRDARVRQAFYQKVIQSLDMGESNYLLLLASDSYDVPRRNRDAMRAEGSDEVFSYILCAVCPVKTGKTELGYFSGAVSYTHLVRGFLTPSGMLPASMSMTIR